MKKTFIKGLLFITSIFGFISCENELNMGPESSNSVVDFFNSKADVEQALIGCYDELQSSAQYGFNFIYLMEVRSDNSFSRSITNSGGEFGDIELFRENPTNSRLNATWVSCYRGIQRANVVLNRVNTVEMTDEERNKIVGEAKFIRALTYFNLVRIWGDVPLMVEETEDPFEYICLPRTSKDIIYEFIKNELVASSDLLNSNSQDGRATRGAAKTLLGKVYLTLGEYQNAVNVLSTIIGTYTLVPNYANIFTVANENNSESIFEIQYKSGLNGEGSSFANYMAINQSQVQVGAVFGDNLPTPNLINLYTSTDTRKNVNIGTLNGGFYCNKYIETLSLSSDGDKNFIVLRYADVLLMYAEALNEVNYIPNGLAFDMLNQVRVRAIASGAYNATQLPTQEAFREAVAKERQLELAFENHRWFDLLRTNKAIQVINNHTLKNGAKGNIASYQLLYPIPQIQIDASAGALTQNANY